MHVSNQTQIIKTELNIIFKNEYIKTPYVKEFVNWLDLRLDSPDSFNHTYFLLKTKQPWQCNNLYDAFENYRWPYSFVCPVQGKRVSGAGFGETFEYLNLLALSFRNSLERNDTAGVINSALAMLTWGGVLNKNRERLLNMGDGICGYFRSVRESLTSSSCCLGGHDGVIMNSGFTKLYFLLIDDFIMYDGRVGAALGLLGRLYAEEAGLKELPEEIEFSFGSGRTSAFRQKSGNRRNPGSTTYKLPSFNGNPTRQLNDNIKASWLLKELADKTDSRFSLLPQASPLNERMTAIQSALFMIGYDVSMSAQSRGR